MSNLRFTNKIFLIILATCYLTAPLSFAKTVKSSISIKVKDRVQDDRTREQDEEDNEDRLEISDVTKDWEICELSIELRNKADIARTCEIEWYFIGEDIPTYNVEHDDEPEPDETILDYGKKTIVVQPKTKANQSVKSKRFVFENELVTGENYDTGFFYYRENAGGQLYSGYVILVKAGDLILASDASSKKYLSEKWLKKLKQ